MTRKELLKRIDFEAKWLFDCGIYGNEVDMAFHSIRHFVNMAFDDTKALQTEPMDDLISRQEVCNIVDAIRDCISVEGYWAILERLKKLPSVNPQPKTGHWIINEWSNISCSECGCTALYDKVYPGKSVFGKAIRVKTTFCPTCGARMLESEG